MGVVEKTNYHLCTEGSEDEYFNGDCLHRLSISWKAVAKKLSDGIKPRVVRERFDIYHLISTSVSIDPFKAMNLIESISH